MNKIPFWYWFNYFALFNGVFLALQLVFLFLQSSSFIQALPLPFSVYAEIAATLLLQVLLYLLLAVFQTFLLWGTHAYWPEQKASERWLLVIFIISVAAILSLNCYFFPVSIFSMLFLPPVPISVITIILIISLFFLFLLMLNTLCLLFRYKPRLMTTLLIPLFLLYFYAHFTTPPLQKNNSNKPNIIIIGVDSLSPKYVNAIRTPTLDQFLGQSVRFVETVSPLARTSPAWASILTGLYPLHHQGRYNLLPGNIVKSSASIAWTLQKKGYQTLFASDDRRFNNIDEDFGFQQIVGPKMGVNDMLIGTFNDFPLGNLLINTKIGSWLLPYNYINRASHFSYYPSVFDTVLKNAITHLNPHDPQFLAVHFTLPHWPHIWATSSPPTSNTYTVTEEIKLYNKALHRTDKQIKVLLQILNEQNLLKNSLIIILSDHGETLNEKNSRLTRASLYQGQSHRFVDYLQRKTDTPLTQSEGHGSDLLSPDQFHCLLGFKIFRNNKPVTQAAVVTTRVALIDIAPTINEFLHLPSRQVDGISLLPTILDPKRRLSERAFMLESGILPNQHVKREQASIFGALFFTVNPVNNRLEIRQDRIKDFHARKLYAILAGDWIVALYPDDKEYVTVLLRLSDGKWTDEPDSAFAQTSPLKIMLPQLLNFYRDELAIYPNSHITPLLR